MTALIRWLSVVSASLSLAPSFFASVYAHPIGPLGAEPLTWQNEQISQVIAGGTYISYTPPKEFDTEGKKCVSGNSLNFNVRDDYAYDIDEAVQLDIEFYVPLSARELTLVYDRNGTAPSYNGVRDSKTERKIELSADPQRHWVLRRFSLERARFANSLFSGTDFSISYQPDLETDASGKIADVAPGPHILTVCGVTLKRSYTTPSPSSFGNADIKVLDENGQLTPVRLGLYDRTGRLPMPNEEAVALRNYNNMSRIVAIRPGAVPWPEQNHSVFYVSGSYHPALPVGDYELVVAKGPEYRLVRRSFSVTANKTTVITINLQRWSNMEAKGWYSGDDHIHYARASELDDRSLLLFIEAEGLNLGNILQEGNSGNTYFRQYNWKEIANAKNTSFVIVPGQEDPRTVRRGHSIQLDIKEPIRDPSHYLLYNEVFSKAHAQGGTTGYAHIGWSGGDGLNGRAGMALDVPFGLVDFVEVLQVGNLDPKTWFDFLNLGYKLSPSAGSDYPYGDIPGAVRTYVNVGATFTPNGWFDGLRHGRNFVTNGPMLDFAINRQEMGSDLRGQPGESLTIEAIASLNPDIDRLVRLELIEQGEVIKTVSSDEGAEKLNLREEIKAKHSTWFVVRAIGKPHEAHEGFWGAGIFAMSAPIYVYVDGPKFWKPSIVPALVTQLKEDMNAILIPDQFEIENWDTDGANAKYWEAQKPLLKERIDRVTTIYDALARRATHATDGRK